jgi:hypothetical protein
MQFLDQGNEDFLINMAIVKVAREDEQKEKVEELKALSSRTASELARFMAPLLRL